MGGQVHLTLEDLTKSHLSQSHTIQTDIYKKLRKTSEVNLRFTVFFSLCGLPHECKIACVAKQNSCSLISISVLSLSLFM